MPTLDVRRIYDDGITLTEADLDAFLDDLETFFNTTKIDADNIQDSAITNAKMAANSVDTSQLVAEAVTTAKIEDDAVTTAKIAADAITSAEIADDAVDTDQIATDAVETAKIADDAVTTAKIAADAITSAEIADDAVDTDQIATDAVTGAKILDETIISNNIADNAITTDKIINGAVSELKIATAAVKAYQVAFSTSNDTTTGNYEINMAFNATGLLRFTNATATSVTGFINGTAGRIIYICRTGAGALTIQHAGAGTQPIYTLSGGNISLSANQGGITLICDGTVWWQVG